MTIWKKYGYFWATLGLFLFSLIGHWVFGWEAYTQEQYDHNQPAELGRYVVEAARDTLENWQSEFLQLIWQVAGLAYLFHIGSPQSKEGDDRKEEKLDLILKKLDPKLAEEEIKKLDRKFQRT
jgi:hypothetical protein